MLFLELSKSTPLRSEPFPMHISRQEHFLVQGMKNVTNYLLPLKYFLHFAKHEIRIDLELEI